MRQAVSGVCSKVVWAFFLALFFIAMGVSVFLRANLNSVSKSVYSARGRISETEALISLVNAEIEKASAPEWIRARALELGMTDATSGQVQVISGSSGE